MANLVEEKCEACRVGAPLLSEQELEELKPQIPEWELVHVEGVPQLHRHYSFKNFNRAWAFATQVALLAEKHGHHPAITAEWGKVTVAWWTHKIKGLHRNDAILAAQTDALFAT